MGAPGGPLLAPLFLQALLDWLGFGGVSQVLWSVCWDQPH